MVRPLLLSFYFCFLHYRPDGCRGAVLLRLNTNSLVELWLHHELTSYATSKGADTAPLVFLDFFLEERTSPKLKMAANRNSPKVHRSKVHPDLEYTVESFCVGYKKSVHKNGRGPLVCHGLNFVRVTVKKGEVRKVLVLEVLHCLYTFFLWLMLAGGTSPPHTHTHAACAISVFPPDSN